MAIPETNLCGSISFIEDALRETCLTVVKFTVTDIEQFEEANDLQRGYTEHRQIFAGCLVHSTLNHSLRQLPTEAQKQHTLTFVTPITSNDCYRNLMSSCPVCFLSSPDNIDRGSKSGAFPYKGSIIARGADTSSHPSTSSCFSCGWRTPNR